MSVTHYYTENWIVTSYETLRKFLQWAIDEDGNFNKYLKGNKVLLVESGLDLSDKKPPTMDKNKRQLHLLSMLIRQHKHLGIDFVIVTNTKPEFLDPEIGKYIEEFKTW